jgi:hypothetical protein
MLFKVFVVAWMLFVVWKVMAFADRATIVLEPLRVRLHSLGDAASVMQQGFSGSVLYENASSESIKPVLFDVLGNCHGGAKLYPNAVYDVTLVGLEAVDARKSMLYSLHHGRHSANTDTDNELKATTASIEMVITDQLYLTNVSTVSVCTTMNVKVLV